MRMIPEHYLREIVYFNRCVLEYILTKYFRYISENITENYNDSVGKLLRVSLRNV